MSTSRPQTRRTPVGKESERNCARILLNGCVAGIRALIAYYIPPSPISSLPFEILAEIFAFYHSWYDLWELGRNHFSWLAITVVCRRWREVALNSPSFWCSIHLIDGVRSNFIQQFLNRSRGLPLVLNLFVYWNIPREALHVVLPQSHRIKAMSISLRKAGYDALNHDLLFQPLPSLRRLTLTKPVLILDDGGVDDSSTIPILRSGFDTLTIRELVVTGYELREHSSLLTPRLTSLQFSESYFQRNEITPPQDILRILSLLPNLQNLSLKQPHDQNVGGHPDTPLSLDAPVELRHLRRLRLGGTIAMCVSILSNLVFPTSVALSVDLNQYPSESQLPSLAQCLISHLAGTHRIGAAEPVLSCTFSVEHEGSGYPIMAVFHLWTSHISYGHYHYDVTDRTPPAFELTFVFSNVEPPIFIQKLFLRLPLRSVTSLSLTGVAPIVLSGNLSALSKLCEAMPNITELNSRDRGKLPIGNSYIPIRNYSVLLGPVPLPNAPPTGFTSRGGSRRQRAGRARPPPPRYRFPKLKTLRLEGIDFHLENTVPWISQMFRRSYRYTKVIDEWVDILQQRRRHGFPITTLLLRECYWVGDEEVDLFRTVVEHFRLPPTPYS